MNMLLVCLLIAAGGAAYFETTYQQQTADGFQEQESAWQSEDDSLRGENKQLILSKKELEKDIDTTTAEIANLTGHGKTTDTSAPAPAVVTTTPAPAPMPATTSLGTISTVDGQRYENCQLLKVEADGITFSHAQGITKVMYSNLPSDKQALFEVDPTTGQASSAARTRYSTLIQQQGAATPSQ